MSDRTQARWLVIGFLVSFVSVGVPYWLLPYDQLSLPGALSGPGLYVALVTALLLAAFRTAPFWRVVAVVAASVPGVVLARVVLDALRDPTSHNLWPLEVVIALVIGLLWTTAGAIAGSLLMLLVARRTPWKGDKP